MLPTPEQYSAQHGQPVVRLSWDTAMDIIEDTHAVIVATNAVDFEAVTRIHRAGDGDKQYLLCEFHDPRGNAYELQFRKGRGASYAVKGVGCVVWLEEHRGGIGFCMLTLLTTVPHLHLPRKLPKTVWSMPPEEARKASLQGCRNLSWRWWVNADPKSLIPDSHKEPLHEHAVKIAAAMSNQGYREGELNTDLDGTIYRGWWESQAT